MKYLKYGYWLITSVKFHEIYWFSSFLPSWNRKLKAREFCFGGNGARTHDTRNVNQKLKKSNPTQANKFLKLMVQSRCNIKCTLLLKLWNVFFFRRFYLLLHTYVIDKGLTPTFSICFSHSLSWHLAIVVDYARKPFRKVVHFIVVPSGFSVLSLTQSTSKLVLLCLEWWSIKDMDRTGKIIVEDSFTTMKVYFQ